MGKSARHPRRIRAAVLALALVVGASAATLASVAPWDYSATGSSATTTSAEPLEPDAMYFADETPAPAETSSMDAAAVVTAGWLHTEGATILTANNEPHVIRAISWFGMETTNCAPHGLWAISLTGGMAQIASMGFNTIRLPFSNECLASPTTNSIDPVLNPTLQGKSSLEVMDAVIAAAKANGLSVILDRHRPDSAAQSELWYTSTYDEDRWISDWQMLAARYVDEPAVIGADLHNEPHGTACWGCGDAATDWQAAATRAGNAVLAVNPNWLIVVEGVEKQSSSSYTWWGSGLAGVQSAPVTLNTPGRVVYSPHDYPASVYAQSWFSASNYPENLPSVWDSNWGYIAKSGIAPVLLGEFGTTLQTPSDQQWLDTLVDYLGSTGISFAYWSFNPNSGDTGGLVQDDWVTPQSAKLAALAPLLAPGSTATVPAVTPTPTPPNGTTTPAPGASATPGTPASPQAPAAPQTPAAPPTSGGAPLVQSKWTLQSSWDTGYIAEIEMTSATGAGSWTVSWKDTNVTAVANAWGMTCSVVPQQSVTCTGAGWAASLTSGQTYRVGLQVESASAPATPTLSVSAG